MRIEYVFIRKEKAVTIITDKISITNPPLHVVLKKIFTTVSSDTITLKYKSKEYAIHYRYINHECEEVKSDADMHYLIIELDGKNKARIAEVLDMAHSKIFDHDEKANYDIIVSYDGISKYYCDRAYPFINEFERQIRNLIFKLLTRSFGALWLENTATQDQQDSLKAKLQIRSKPLRNQKIIEEALYEMDIKELENYLFVPKSDVDIYELRGDEFTNEKLSELSQKSAIEIIQRLRPLSIWERYFVKKVSIPNLQDKLNCIRNHRNKIAHAKHFHKDDYITCKEILDEMLPQLESAIQDVSVNEYESTQVQETIRGMVDICMSTLKSAMNAGLAISPAMENFSRSVAEYGTLLQNSLSQALKAESQLSQALFGLSSAFSTLPSQSAMQELLPVFSVIKPLESVTKALPLPFNMDAYQNMQPLI